MMKIIGIDYSLNSPALCISKSNEVDIASKQADRFGIHHVSRKVTKNEFFEDLSWIFESMDQIPHKVRGFLDLMHLFLFLVIKLVN